MVAEEKDAQACDAISCSLSAIRLRLRLRSPPRLSPPTSGPNVDTVVNYKMVALQPIFKKAYWTLAAGGLVYVLFITSLTFPEVQRLYEYLPR